APSGTVSFTFNGSPAGSGASETGIYATSAASSSLGAGSYTYDASYAGDSNYNDIAASAVTDEPLTVDKGTLTLTTQIHNASHVNVGGAPHVPLGSGVHDPTSFPARRASDLAPSGTVSFTFNGSPAGSGASETGIYATSAASSSLGAGNYTYDASYAG